MNQEFETPKIIFDDDESRQSEGSIREQASIFARLVIQFSRGIVTTEAQANFVLLIFAGVIVALSIGITMLFSGTYVIDGGEGLSNEELEAYQKIQPYE